MIEVHIVYEEDNMDEDCTHHYTAHCFVCAVKKAANPNYKGNLKPRLISAKGLYSSPECSVCNSTIHSTAIK